MTTLDMNEQRFIAACERRQRHDSWLQKQNNATKMSQPVSRVRLLMLVDEAYRLESLHIHHQRAYCKEMLPICPPNAANQPMMQTGRVNGKSMKHCPCTRAFTVAQLQPRYRALHLLMSHFPPKDIEMSFAQVRKSYRTDEEMLVDLMERYGPDDTREINVRVWLSCTEDRLASLEERWQGIRRKVDEHMQAGDNTSSVIRSLSVMRIFIEGSQSEYYGVDAMDRTHREAIHQTVLDEVGAQGAIFLR